MANPWHMNWADKVDCPEQVLLDKWSLSKWLTRKALDIVKTLADINHTISIVGENDELFNRCRAIESEVLGYLTERFPVGIPVLVDYIPKMISITWIGNRVKELERQRDQFSTMAYWVEPKPDPTQANKALNLVTTSLGRYQMLSAADWRGVIEALQEYVIGLEETQMLLVVARNFQCVKGDPWDGPPALLALKIRKELKSIHLKLLEEVATKYPALVVHPWRSDEGMEQMTWEQYQATTIDFWLPDMPVMGPPLILDTKINDRGKTIGFEELLIERRAAIEEQLLEFKAGRFGEVKGFLRREHKAWGRVAQSIGQYKRWHLWPGSNTAPDDDPIMGG